MPRDLPVGRPALQRWPALRFGLEVSGRICERLQLAALAVVWLRAVRDGSPRMVLPTVKVLADGFFERLQLPTITSIRLHLPTGE